MEALAINARSNMGSHTIGILPVTRYARTNNMVGLLVINSTVFDHNQEEDDLIKDMILKLDSFGGLQNCWDGYHADSPSSVAIQKTKNFIKENAGTILPFYFLAPGVNGEIMLEFKDKTKASELYFNDNGSTELLLFDGDELIAETSLEKDPRALFDFFS